MMKPKQWVYQILKEDFEAPPWSGRDRLYEDLGVDSLDRIDLIMAAEEYFDISLSDEIVDKVDRVKDFIKVIKGQIK